MKKIDITYILIFLLLGFSCKEDKLDYGTFGKVTGKVLDSQTYEPIVGVSVTTSPASSAVTTDVNGDFTLENVPDGEVVITTKRSDYKSNSVGIQVFSGKSTPVEIILESNTLSFGNIDVGDQIPADASSDWGVDLDLKWSVSSDRNQDSLKFNLVLFESDLLFTVESFSAISDTTIHVSNLKFQTTYFWQVEAVSDGEVVFRSKILSFSTRMRPAMVIFYNKEVDGYYQVFGTDVEGSYEEQLTNSSTDHYFPQAVGNGRYIAYTALMSDIPYLYVYDTEKKTTHKVSQHPLLGYSNVGQSYSWSFDGEKLVYGYFSELYVVNRDGTGLRKIADAPSGYSFKHCDWGPDGKIVVQTVGAKSYNNEIYLLNADGSNMQLLLDDVAGTMESPSFSPDGSKIVYVRDYSGVNVSGGMLNAHIFSMVISNKVEDDLSSDKADSTNDLYPSISSTGRKVTFVNAPSSGDSDGELWIMDFTGENRIKLFDGVKSCSFGF